MSIKHNYIKNKVYFCREVLCSLPDVKIARKTTHKHTHTTVN